ncbi:MAG: GNAT family N-acetyltransferase [Candidatus Sericytochromatia bacterium]|nr:GNAT family N-acetyltransferase [Candidatus Sericytochromatia bacterium]
MPIHVRRFRPEDLDALLGVYNQARPFEGARLTPERFWAWFSDPALDPERDLRVAEDEAGLVGMVAAFPWPERVAEGHVFIVGPSVLPTHQGQGIGDRLLTALIAELAQRFPGKQALARVAQDNTPARAFLTRRGGFTLDRRFWRLAHDAIGQAPRVAVPAGFTLHYVEPGEDHGEAIATYRAILGAPHPAMHLLGEAELRAWQALGAYTPLSFLTARGGDGRLAGLCFQTLTGSTNEAVLQFLGVLPPVRGRGLASALLSRALLDAHAEGRSRMRLEVSGTDDSVLSLYTRAGFRPEGSDAFYSRPL